jgi:hypothetical protein
MGVLYRQLRRWQNVRGTVLDERPSLLKDADETEVKLLVKYLYLFNKWGLIFEC